jgi:hypothetical protein
MKNLRAVLAMVAIGSLLAACGEAGSADETGQTADFDLLVQCGEARGALLELASMRSHRERVNTSSLDSGELQMRRLAHKVSAPGEVRQDIDLWDQAVQAWLDGIRAIPPNIVQGRLVEPDTSALDEALVNELRPAGERLTHWVGKVCGKP